MNPTKIVIAVSMPCPFQSVAAGLVSATQGIGFIVGPAVSTALYAWDKALPFWVFNHPLRLPKLGDAES